VKVEIEEIYKIWDRISEINKEKIENIDFYENGEKLKFTKTLLDHFKFTGLNNIDFIRYGYNFSHKNNKS
jgi:hypothetical protein